MKWVKKKEKKGQSKLRHQIRFGRSREDRPSGPAWLLISLFQAHCWATSVIKQSKRPFLISPVRPRLAARCPHWGYKKKSYLWQCTCQPVPSGEVGGRNLKYLTPDAPWQDLEESWPSAFFVFSLETSMIETAPLVGQNIARKPLDRVYCSEEIYLRLFRRQSTP